MQCVLRKRNRYAPKAITDPGRLTPDKVVYLLETGHIYEVQIRDIEGPRNEPRTYVHFQGNALGPMRLPLYTMGVLPYPTTLNSGADRRPKYDASFVVFDNPLDAAKAASHPEYPFRRSTRAIARDLRCCSIGFSGNRDLPIRDNPNI